ncbi:MAG: DNA-binding response regulator [Deltaproteobacteria bacterium]|nr:MAG: DNA-binding response regulator [Deltaproteobacteria bacterium]
MKRIRIMIVDDHPVVREGLRAMLATQSDFEVVGEAANGKDLLERYPQAKPDVIILDLEMPRMDGLTAIEALASAPVAIIVLTAFDTDERIVSAIKAGARGYLLKGAAREELFTAIRTVHAGDSLLQPVVATRLMRHLRHDVSELTPRELEVLGLVARGLRNREIAEELFISERTVKFHLRSIMDKLDAKTRTEAVSRALSRGLIDPR